MIRLLLAIVRAIFGAPRGASDSRAPAGGAANFRPLVETGDELEYESVGPGVDPPVETPQDIPAPAPPVETPQDIPAPAPPVETPQDIPAPLPARNNRPVKGVIRLEGKMFADEYGIYPAIGATYMYAARSAEVDEARLVRNLDWLSERGCDYIRILLMVGNPPYWPYQIQPRSWDLYHRVMELAWERRIRTQPVIFADAQVMMPGDSDRETFVREVAAFCNHRREMIQFIEVANESSLNGVGMAELARYCSILSTTTEIPFAASSPAGSLHPEAGLEELYSDHGCRSPIATPHFDRTFWEDGYRICRQPWHYQYIGESGYMPAVFVNNEPAGVGPSSGRVTIPEQIGMGALCTFLSGGAAYCFHSVAGVKGLDRHNAASIDFCDISRGDEMWASMRAMVRLVPSDIANGQAANHHWTSPRHPLEPSLNDQIWPDGHERGLVRAFARGFGRSWYVGLLGIRGSVAIAPNRHVAATLYEPISGAVVWSRAIAPGDVVAVDQVGERRSYVLTLVDV